MMIGHWRYDMHRAANRGRGAGGDADIIQERLKAATDIQRFVAGKAVLVLLGGADAHTDHEILRGRGAHRLQSFGGEADTIFQRAAVFVLAAVDTRVEELRRKIAMARHQFDAVDARFHHAPGRCCIACDDFIDHALVEGARHDAEAFIGRNGGSVGNGQQSVAAFHDLAAGVEKLREQPAILRMTDLGETAITLDAIVIGRHQHM